MSQPSIEYRNPSETGGASPAQAVKRGQQVFAIAVLALFVFGGIGLAWWKLYTPLPDEPLVEVGGGRGFQGRFQQPQPPRDGVRRSGNSYTVRAGECVMVASQNRQNEWRYSFRYQPGKFSSPDQPAFLTAKYQSMALGLSDEQKKQFDALPPFAQGMVLDQAEQEQLEKLFQEYVAASDADKPAAEKKLVTVLEDLGEKAVPQSLKATDEYVARIRTILTPDQITRLSTPRGPAPGAAAPR